MLLLLLMMMMYAIGVGSTVGVRGNVRTRTRARTSTSKIPTMVGATAAPGVIGRTGDPKSTASTTTDNKGAADAASTAK